MGKKFTITLTSYLDYWDVNNLCGWEMSQKLFEGGFKWVENASQFINKERHNEDIEEAYFLEVDVQYFIHIKSLKHALNDRLVSNKVHRVIVCIESNSLVKTIHWYEHRAKKKSKK